MKQTLLLALALALLASAVLAAQPPERRPGAPMDPTPPTTIGQPGDVAPSAVRPPQDFVPAGQLPQADQLPAAPLLIGAYAFVWVALVVYIWSLWRRMTKIERELADLQRRLQAR